MSRLYVLWLCASCAAPEGGAHPLMPDRLFVYKSPAQRLFEAALIFGGSLLIADYAQTHIPYLSTSILILGLLIVLAFIVPVVGTSLARHFGAPLMTNQQRSRRYLEETRPVFQPYSQTSQRARSHRQRPDRRG